MNWKLVTPPAVEPVSLDEAKAQLRVDGDEENDFITGLIAGAREYFEEVAHRALISQTWRLSLDSWPDEIELPRAPLQSVTSVVYKDADGAPTTIGYTDEEGTWVSDTLLVDTESEPGRIVLAASQSWPSDELYRVNPIQITYVAGYGDEAGDVPAHMRQAIKLLIGHWYENREATITGTIMKEIPLGIDSLIWLSRP